MNIEITYASSNKVVEKAYGFGSATKAELIIEQEDIDKIKEIYKIEPMLSKRILSNIIHRGSAYFDITTESMVIKLNQNFRLQLCEEGFEATFNNPYGSLVIRICL